MPTLAYYWQAARHPAYGFALAMLCWALYEGGLLLFVPLDARQAYNVVDAFFGELLRHQAQAGLWLAVAALGLGLYHLGRFLAGGKPFRLWVLPAMLAEAACWALALYLLLPRLMDELLHVVERRPSLFAGDPGGLGDAVLVSLGAGFYEELVFRYGLVVLLVGLMMLLGLKLALKAGKLLVWVLAAAAFALVHHMVEPFSWPVFNYRLLMGLALSGLYLLRGFGVAVWAHALYDVGVLSLLELANRQLDG